MNRAPWVETIADRTALARLEVPWRELEEADTKAHIFLSWPWMEARLRSLRQPWRVLVVRRGRGGEVVGLLPLRSLREGERWGMAGSPLADLTGLLCAPGDEEAVIDALASVLTEVLLDLPGGGGLTLSDVHDPRVEGLLARLADVGWSTSARQGVVCPHLELGPELEGDWDRLLATRLSASSRATVRRKLRGLEALPGFRVTSIADGGAHSIETLLTLWQRRWGTLPTAQLAEYRSVFTSCWQAGSLWLDLLWQDDTPITGLLAFVGRRRRWFGFYITGFDPRFAPLSPGTAMVAHSVRWALAEGFQTFDFLRGDEPYKRSFGAVPRHGLDLVAMAPARSADMRAVVIGHTLP